MIGKIKLQDDLEPDTEERAMAVLWSAPEAIEKKVFFCLGVELLNCLALCDMILLTFDKHRSSATSLMLGALE